MDAAPALDVLSLTVQLVYIGGGAAWPGVPARNLYTVEWAEIVQRLIDQQLATDEATAHDFLVTTLALYADVETVSVASVFSTTPVPAPPAESE